MNELTRRELELLHEAMHKLLSGAYTDEKQNLHNKVRVALDAAPVS